MHSCPQYRQLYPDSAIKLVQVFLSDFVFSKAQVAAEDFELGMLEFALRVDDGVFLRFLGLLDLLGLPLDTLDVGLLEFSNLLGLVGLFIVFGVPGESSKGCHLGIWSLEDWNGCENFCLVAKSSCWTVC